MLLRRSFFSRLLALFTLFGLIVSVATTVQAQTPYAYRGQRLHFAGEAAMIEAINAMGRAAVQPTASRGHVHAAEVHLRTALRQASTRQSQFQLQAASVNLDSFEVTGDRYQLQAALEATQLALQIEQQQHAVNHRVQRPVLPQDHDCHHGQQFGAVPYSSGYNGYGVGGFGYSGQNIGQPIYVPNGYHSNPYVQQQSGITLQRGPFSITIPLNRR